MSTEYDPDEILARMRADSDHDWPWRLLSNMAKRPLIAEESLPKTRDGRTGDLYPSEIRVLEAASRGLTMQMTADLYGIGRETVKTELESARYRLRAKNTTHACCEALRLGLISASPSASRPE